MTETNHSTLGRLALCLLPVGPLAVAVIRLELPYYHAKTNLAAVQSVAAHPGRESLVLWLGLIAFLTLLPGVLGLAAALPASRVRTAGLVLAAAGYLCIGVLFIEDSLLWSAAHIHANQAQTAALLGANHPAISIATGIFVAGHVLGTVLLGVALLRAKLVPIWAAWALIVSQPIHFTALVILGSPQVDFVGWSLTAVGMAMVARTLLGRPAPTAPALVATSVQSSTV